MELFVLCDPWTSATYVDLSNGEEGGCDLRLLCWLGGDLYSPDNVLKFVPLTKIRLGKSSSTSYDHFKLDDGFTVDHRASERLDGFKCHFAGAGGAGSLSAPWIHTMTKTF